MKSSKILLSLIVTSLIAISPGCKKDSGLPVDGDGNEYHTVTIGTQVWLNENLKTTKYNNGVSIPLVTDNDQWTSMSSAAFCWYGNNSTAVKETYGALYNGWAVNVSFLCPAGYHVPNDEEWNTLINYLGGEDIAGEKLKATGTQFWSSGSHATNETGFTSLPGGTRSPNGGTFDSMRSSGCWWSSTPGHYVNMVSGQSYAYIYGLSPRSGFSVRCIKDE